MSLYCDNTVARDVVVPCEAQPGEHVSGEFPAVFWARSKTLCRQAAKQAGWRFFADGRILPSLCPRRHRVAMSYIVTAMRRADMLVRHPNTDLPRLRSIADR